MDTTKITALMVTDHRKDSPAFGCAMVFYCEDKQFIDLSLQDNGRTLKVVIKEVPPE